MAKETHRPFMVRQQSWGPWVPAVSIPSTRRLPPPLAGGNDNPLDSGIAMLAMDLGFHSSRPSARTWFRLRRRMTVSSDGGECGRGIKYAHRILGEGIFPRH